MLKKVRSAFGGDDGDKHTALIDEFKLAHKKMFRHQQSVDEASNVPNAGDDRPLAVSFESIYFELFEKNTLEITLFIKQNTNQSKFYEY